MFTPPIPANQRLYVFEVRASKTHLIDTVSVIHSNSRDAAFAAIRQVRRTHNLPERAALFATQKAQTYRSEA